MKEQDTSSLYFAIERKFFNGDISSFEAYHQLRLIERTEGNAAIVIQSWIDNKSIIEAIFGKGKE